MKKGKKIRLLIHFHIQKYKVRIMINIITPCFIQAPKKAELMLRGRKQKREGELSLLTGYEKKEGLSR